MPLSNLTLNANVQWQLSKTNSGFSSTTFGPASSNFNLNGINLTTFNQLAALEYTSIASSGSETVDLTSLTNLVGESFSFGHVLGIMVLPVGQPCTFGPGAANPQQWFFGGTTETIIAPAGSGFCYSAGPTDTGSAVDSTHKTLTFTNSGAGTMTSLTVLIWGSTS